MPDRFFATPKPAPSVKRGSSRYGCVIGGPATTVKTCVVSTSGVPPTGEGTVTSIARVGGIGICHL